MSNQKQISNLSSQVETLGAINSTLQRYLEVVISKVSPDDAHDLIKSERARLSEIEQMEQLRKNPFYRHAFPEPIEIEHFKQALLKAKTYSEFLNILIALTNRPIIKEFGMDLEHSEGAMMALNEGRIFLEMEPFPLDGDDKELTKKPSGRKK